MRAVPDGRMKVTFLTVKPANPEAPTAAELNAGIDLSGAFRLGGYSIAGKDLEALGYNDALEDLGERDYEECPCCEESDYTSTPEGDECVKAYDDYAEEQGYDPWAFTRKPLGEYKTDFTINREYSQGGFLRPVSVPQPGAILVWDGSRRNVYGHVAIVYYMKYRKRRPLIHNGGRPR